ncbi:MAG: triphosphoribosyl-dephospho-CoA synthase [Planctomycetaceae bacterium]
MDAPVATTVTHRALRAVNGLASAAGSRGWCAALAGVLEATAEKPGNVHPRRAFPDLTYDDLVAAATAIAPAMDRAVTTRLGRTIRDAVEAARTAVDTNANLGIVLLTAPLAAVPDGVALDAAAVDDVLASLDAADASDVWQAIAVARPGGLGRVDRDDTHGPPPGDLRAAMRAAADRDLIARMWAEGFGPLFTGAVADLRAALAAGVPPLDAIVDCHLRQLAREPDSLIVRRHGPAAAREVSAGAAAILRLPPAERPTAVAAFDDALRSPRRLNPGTTADVVAAALYILLRSGDLLPQLRPAVASS